MVHCLEESTQSLSLLLLGQGRRLSYLAAASLLYHPWQPCARTNDEYDNFNDAGLGARGNRGGHVAGQGVGVAGGAGREDCGADLEPMR